MTLQDVSDALNGMTVEDGPGKVRLTFTPSVSPVFPALEPVFPAGGSIKISSATRVQTSDAIIFNGTATAAFPEIKDGTETRLKEIVDLPVEAVFRAGADVASVSIWFKLQENGRELRFGDIFSDLPTVPDGDIALERRNTVLQFLEGSLANACLVVTSDAVREPARPEFPAGLDLSAGLNFVGLWTPGALFGGFQELLGSPVSLVLTGPIVPKGDGAVALTRGQYPWEAAAPVQGIHLKADLDVAVKKLGVALALESFRIYTPLNDSFIESHPTFQPAVAFTGRINTPSATGAGHATVAVTVEKPLGTDDVFLTGRFEGVTLGALLADIVGKAGTEIIPPSILENIPDISLTSVVVNIRRDSDGISVASISVLVKPANVKFSLLTEPKLEASVDSLSILVTNPFASGRHLSARVTGTVAIFDSKFNVALDLPGLRVSAEQAEEKAIPLATVVEFLLRVPGLPKPPDIQFQNIRFTAIPGKTFDFSMAVDPSASAAGLILGGVRLPRIGVSVTNEGWSLAGGKDADGSALQLGALIDSLIDEIDAFDGLKIPDGIKGLTVDSFTLAYEKDSKTFRFDCKGKLPLATATSELKVEAHFTAELTNAVGRKTQRFGGALFFKPKPDRTLQFDLRFGRGGKSNILLANFQNASGAPLKVSDLIGLLVPNAPEVDITLNTALLVLIRGAGATKVLAGLDMGAGLNLSNLPLVGAALPPSETVRLSYRLLAPSAPFSILELNEINGVLPPGSVPLPVTSPLDGVKIAGRLEFGSTTQELDLPIVSRPQPAQPGDLPVGNAVSTPAPIKWINLQKTLGPVHFERIGFQITKRVENGVESPVMTFALDASLQAGPLTLTMDGLSISTPLTRFDPRFDLRGIGIQFRNDPIAISGLFLREKTSAGRDRYSGAAIISAKNFSLSAFGSFVPADAAVPGDQPSIFIFAVFDKSLGGPSFFFVTGLAAGFGYNRDLLAPPISGVAEFPLLKAADGQPDFNDLPKMLKALNSVIPPRTGSYWLAAGIKFKSFQVINSFALLLVKFGNDLEILLLGKSTLTLPLPAEGKTTVAPYVYIELAIKVSIRPAQGLISAEALLTDNSFVIDKSCRLSGGFAFYLWYDPPADARPKVQKGDFVLTIGGYHPRFKVPAHYPRVPRLAINWPRPPISIKGEAYFALTPSCVMAGGSLEASYKDGSLEACFILRADFLISWNPFFYDIEVFLSIRAALVVETIFGDIRLGTELSASVLIWGPEFSGIATVTWSVISFSVSFGAAGVKQAPSFLSFAKFQESFLPAAADICRVHIASGLVREIPALSGAANAQKEWVVRPDELALATESAIPSTHVNVTNTAGVAVNVIASSGPIGMRPMGSGPIASTHTVKITRLASPGRAAEIQNLQANWLFPAEGQRQGVPAELWNTVNTDDGAVKAAKPGPGAELLPNRLIGFRQLRPADKGLSTSNPPVMDVRKAFDFIIVLKKTLPLNRLSRADFINANMGAVEAPANDDFIGVIKTTVVADTIRERRGLAVVIAAAHGFPGLSDGSLGLLSREAETLLQFPPMLGALGSPGIGAPPAIASVAPIEDLELPESFRTTLITVLAQLDQDEQGKSDGSIDTPDDERELSAEAPPAADLEENPSQGRTMIVGRSVVWAIEPGAPGSPVPAFAVSGGANMSFRVVALDEFGELLQNDVRPAQQARLPRKIPAQLIVTGLTTLDEPPTVFGWRADTPLLQVGRLRFIAEGATVDVDATPDNGESVFRVISGRDAMGATATVKTHLPENARTLAVVIRRSERTSPPALGTFIEVFRPDGVSLRLMPLHVIRESESEYVLLCRVPANLRRDLANHAAFRVRAAGGGEDWEVSGVVGLADSIFHVRNNWADVKLTPAVQDRTPGLSPQAGIQFTAATGAAQ